MTTELTKAAQQALEALKLCYDVVEYPANGTSRQDKAIAALERALTQRPAAQTERDILNDSAWIAGAKFGWNCGVEGTRDLLNQCIEQRIKDRVEARASLPASQQATPEPVGEPVARVELMQTGGNAGLATRIVEIDDPLRERLRPGDLLFTRPATGVPEWQPIETAPKDGRDLILLLTPSGFPQVTYSNTWWQSGFSVECRPTGWMPLPAHPLAAAQAKGGE